MKNILKALLVLTCVGLLFVACNKLEDLPFIKTVMQ